MWKLLKLVINRIRSHMLKHGDVLDIDEITNHLSIDLIGIVADDDDVIKGMQPRGTNCV